MIDPHRGLLHIKDLLPGRVIIYLVFHRKVLCDARPKMQSLFKFLDVLFALKSDGPLIDEALGQVDIFVRSLDQADLWSDVPPTRGI